MQFQVPIIKNISNNERTGLLPTNYYMQMRQDVVLANLLLIKHVEALFDMMNSLSTESIVSWFDPQLYGFVFCDFSFATGVQFTGYLFLGLCPSLQVQNIK